MDDNLKDLKKRANGILVEIPHLSDRKKHFWKNKINQMDAIQLEDFIAILSSENQKLKKMYLDEILESGSEDDLSELKGLLNKAERKIQSDKEALDRQKDTDELEKLIDNI